MEVHFKTGLTVYNNKVITLSNQC